MRTVQPARGPAVTPQPSRATRAQRGPHLVLTGFMGAGKSTVGRLLAERLGHPFIDLDGALATRAGCSIAEIFARDGEAGFRDLETALLVQLADELADTSPRVIATGGGVLEREINRAMLRQLGVCAWLQAPWPVLSARIAADKLGVRPLAAAEDARAGLRDRWRRRNPTYATADFAVDAAQAPAAVADDLLAGQRDALKRLFVDVPLQHGGYRVCIGGGALALSALRIAALAPSHALVVVDSQVATHWLAPLRTALDGAAVPHSVHLLPTGEAHKTLATVSRIWDDLLAFGADRSAVVVGLGGGVTGDMAGFAAAAALRGLRVVQVPTSLLAMVDASVGGKTGVNHAQGKNLIGAFHQPSWVGCDLTTLTTLAERERIAGLAEVIKVALTLDAELLSWLERDVAALRRGDADVLRPVIARAVGLKATVVARDEREGGLRRVLNFGHTVAHAIERTTGYARYRHGEAVALGMVAALVASVAQGCCAATLLDRAIELMCALGLPTQLPADIDRVALRDALRHDKKRSSSGVRFILCAGPGRHAERWLPFAAIPLEGDR